LLETCRKHHLSTTTLIFSAIYRTYAVRHILLAQTPRNPLLTIRMHQLDQRSRMHHKRHTNIMPQNRGRSINLAHISKDAGSEPDTAKETAVSLVGVAIRCCRTVECPCLFRECVFCYLFEIVAVDYGAQWWFLVGLICGWWGFFEGVAAVDSALDCGIGFGRHDD